MGILSTLKGFFMRLFNIRGIEGSTGLKISVSDEMRDKIALWNSIYAGKAPWNDKAPSCGVLDTIAGLISIGIGEEIDLRTDNEAIENVLQKLNSEKFQIVQYIVSCGSCLVRPVYANDKIQYEVLPLGSYLPTRYDFDGAIQEAVILKQFAENGKNYVLFESHAYQNKNHSVTNTLYENTSGSLKKRMLTDTVQTENITESFTWQNVDMPFIIEFRNRAVNKIDGSKVPVSMIAGIEHLIEDADKQYARMNWEQEGGELKVFADADLFRPRQNAKGTTDTFEPIDPKLRKLFVKLNGDTSDDTDKITTHSPTLRVEQQNAMLQQIFRRIEQASSIGKGTISDMESVEQTATQFQGGKKAFFSILDTIEGELEDKYKHCAYVFAYMASAYNGVPFDDEISVSYNDMVRKDPQQMKQTAMQEITAGVLNGWEYRMQFYGETEEEAKAKVPEKVQGGYPF